MHHSRSTHRYQNELTRRQEERRARRNESGKSKPFTGFTSPYRRLNEQALLQKMQQHDNGRHSSKRSIFQSPNRIGDYRHSQNPDTPNRGRYDRKRFDGGLPRSNISSRYDLNKYPLPKSANDPYRSNYDPWNSKLSREIEHNNRYTTNRMGRRERDDNSGQRAEHWHSSNRGRDYEAPMDPKEFEQQCRQAYVRAAQERQRNADMSVWGKCDWATYDRYK